MGPYLKNPPPRPERIKSLTCPYAPRVKINGGPETKILPCPKDGSCDEKCVNKDYYPMCWKIIPHWEMVKSSIVFNISFLYLEIKAFGGRKIRKMLGLIAPENFKKDAAYLLLNTISVHHFTGLTET